MKPSAVSGPDANDRIRGLRARRLVLLATTIAASVRRLSLFLPISICKADIRRPSPRTFRSKRAKCRLRSALPTLSRRSNRRLCPSESKSTVERQTSGLGLRNDVPPGLRELSVAFECQMFRTGKKVCRADMAGTSLPAKVQASSFLRMATQ